MRPLLVLECIAECQLVTCWALLSDSWQRQRQLHLQSVPEPAHAYTVCTPLFGTYRAVLLDDMSRRPLCSLQLHSR